MYCICIYISIREDINSVQYQSVSTRAFGNGVVWSTPKPLKYTFTAATGNLCVDVLPAAVDSILFAVPHWNCSHTNQCSTRAIGRGVVWSTLTPSLKKMNR